VFIVAVVALLEGSARCPSSMRVHPRKEAGARAPASLAEGELRSGGGVNGQASVSEGCSAGLPNSDYVSTLV